MIEIKNLHKSFSGVAVLKGVNLKIPAGKITVIMGRSGSGKTVLLRHIIGLLKPDQGQVLVGGVNIHQLNQRELNKFRRKFGMLFQSGALLDSLTVYENVVFPLLEHGTIKDPVRLREIVQKKLALVGLWGVEDRLPAELSGGMRKRVGLARAIALEPEIILYDEPVTGLDPIMTMTIDNLILSMQRTLKVTSLVISHDVHSALRIADQVAMLSDGQMVECAAPEFFKRSGHPLVKEFLGSVEK